MTTEILVHITAPTSATHDANYRALATAYLGFEPAARVELPPPGSSADDEGPLIAASRPASGGSVKEPYMPLGPSLASPELSFRSAAHNNASPRLRQPRCEPASETQASMSSQSSWQPPASVVSDSYPENDLRLAAYCSPTRILEHYLHQDSHSQSQTSGQSLQPVVVSSSLPAGDKGHDVVVCEQPQLESTQSSGAEVIPVSPPTRLLQPACLRSLAQADGGESETVKATPLAAARHRSKRSLQDLTTLSRADSDPLPAKRQRQDVDAYAASQAIVRSSSDVGPKHSRHQLQRQQALQETLTQQQQQQQQQQAPSLSDSLEIASPEPPVSAGDVDPASLVTERLRKLARDLDLARRFGARRQARALRPLERGHWELACGGWDEGARRRAWDFLANYVGGGLAGWGIWCRRDPAFSRIRLYCWAAVAGHAYLLLYLATWRRTKHCGCRWVDGEGETVIEMDARAPTGETGET